MGRKPASKLPDNEPLPPDVDDSKFYLNFKWKSYRPDQREYRQQSLELEPVSDTFIQLEVPKELIVPSDNHQILTLDGMKYVLDQFDKLFLSNKKEVVSSPDEWEKEGEEPEAETASSSNDDEWETELEDKKEADKMPWDEANEEWS